MELIKLENSLYNIIGDIDLVNRDYIWIGIIENKKARKYKYEAYWFNSDEHLREYLNISYYEKVIDSSDSKMCENIRQAYSNCFYHIKKFLEEFPNAMVSINDYTELNIEE